MENIINLGKHSNGNLSQKYNSGVIGVIHSKHEGEVKACVKCNQIIEEVERVNKALLTREVKIDGFFSMHDVLPGNQKNSEILKISSSAKSIFDSINFLTKKILCEFLLSCLRLRIFFCKINDDFVKLMKISEVKQKVHAGEEETFIEDKKKLIEHTRGLVEKYIALSNDIDSLKNKLSVAVDFSRFNNLNEQFVLHVKKCSQLSGGTIKKSEYSYFKELAVDMAKEISAVWVFFAQVRPSLFDIKFVPNIDFEGKCQLIENLKDVTVFDALSNQLEKDVFF